MTIHFLTRQLIAALLLCLGLAANAQTIFVDSRRVASDSPEGWAMRFVTAASLVTGFGADPGLAPGQWALSAELASIPHLDQAQRQVGFGGAKAEDLNKSPVFGRARLWLGLPAGLTAELGYTPALEINGAKPGDLYSLALGRQIYQHNAWQGYARVFVQRGRVGGDITCSAEIAGVDDVVANPFGCASRSSDRLSMDYQGIELVNAWQSAAGYRYSLGLGWADLNPDVQVDAPLFFDVRDRSRLHTDGSLRFFSLGLARAINSRWDLAAELLYVPLRVRRSAADENDPYFGLRLQARWRSAPRQ